jgi:UDP-glucuronate decarboxylase
MSESGVGERVLVTGGAGFLGAHLCKKLLERGDEVIAVDNFSTGERWRTDELQHHARFQIVRHDITVPLPDDPRYEKLDRIYNLAAPASPVHYRRQPLATAKANVVGTLNLLELAVRSGARFLQASTSEVYGDPSVHPQTEGYWGNVNPIGIRAPYTEGKRAGEMLVSTYHREHRVPVRIVRIFNTYGPGISLNDGRVVSTFIVQALTGEPVPIHGSGVQTRSFCFVDDLIDGLMRTMDHEDEIVGQMNLGNPEEITVSVLAELIREVTGSRSKIEYRPTDPDDPHRRRPDISLAAEKIQWQPTISLREGIERTVAWIEERLQAGQVAK